MISKRSWWLVAGALSLAGVVSWASSVLWSAPPAQGSGLYSERHPPAAQYPNPSPAPPSTLHAQATSAYHARLFVDDEAVVLITRDGFTTLRAGSTPSEHAVSLGPVAVRQGGTIVFWRNGKLRSISLSGEGERELASVPRAPQHLLESDGQLAWIQSDRQAGTVLQTLSAGEVRSLHESPESASAAALRGGLVYWVSERADGSWSIVRAALDGRPPIASPVHHGRSPAMLAPARDGVYFYAGPQRGVRRLSLDLQREMAVLSQAICSPLVVSSRVVCAQVGGLFELSPPARASRPLAAERAGPITALAATDERAYWVADAGGERLILRSIALPQG